MQLIMQTSAALFVLMLVVSRSESALPKTKTCVEENRVAWRYLTPYVEWKRGGKFNHSGIVLDIFRSSLRACCRGELNLDFTTNFQTQGDVSELSYERKVDFILPVQRSLKSKSFQHFPYVAVVESPGLAFYILPDPSGGQMMIHAIKSVTPLLILMFLMVGISGTLFWMCESMSLAWLGQEPKMFLSGVMSGFWWAFVTMATVGYGDIIPKTKPSKVFSLIWILIGVAFCALFTSSITTMLTLSLITKEVSMSGMEIGVLRGSEEFTYALKKQAVPILFDRIEDLLESVREKSISGVLLDAYVAAEFKDRLDTLHLHEIIEHVSTNGVVFQNNGFRYVSCIRDFVLSRQMEIFTLISRRVKTLTIEKELATKTLIDTDDPSIHIPLFGMMGTLGFFLMIGSFKDWITKKISLADQQAVYEEVKADLSLSQWRKEYKVDLGRTVLDIRNDTDKIKLKAGGIIEKIEKMEKITEATTT